LTQSPQKRQPQASLARSDIFLDTQVMAGKILLPAFPIPMRVAAFFPKLTFFTLFS
jgi:hypothetical protein